MKKLPLYLIAILIIIQGAPTFADNPIRQLFEAATQAYNEGDYPRAIELYENLLDVFPQFAPAYNYLGLSHKFNGSGVDEVVWLFKKAIEIDARYAQAYENLGKVYYGLGEFDKAEEYGLKAIEIDPKMISTHLLLGWIYLLGKSQPRNAIYYFNNVIEKHDISFAYFGLGLAYFKDKQSHRVLEMITLLRQREREDFANHLELMVREQRYVAPDNFSNLASPKRQASTIIKDPYSSSSFSRSSPRSRLSQDPASFNRNNPVQNIPVRLKEKMPQQKGSGFNY